MPTKRTTTCPDCALPRAICLETGGCQPDATRPRSRRLPPLSEERITEALSEVDHYRQLAHDAVATGDLATASGWLEALRDEVQAALTDPAELVAQVDYYRHAANMAAGQRGAALADLRALQAKYDALVKDGS
jgi:hypothetical protein